MAGALSTVGVRELAPVLGWTSSRVPAVMHPSASTTVDVVTDYSAFVALEADWNDAVERAGIQHPFLRHEWIRTWWEAFGTPAMRISILVVRAGGRVIAVAPFMRELTSMYGIPARRVRLIHNDHTPRTDIVVAEQPRCAYAAIWHALRHRLEAWDVLELSQLPRESPTLAIMRGLAEADGCTTGTWQGGDSPFLPLTSTWKELLDGRPARFRSNLRNRMSRLSSIGELSCEVLSRREDLRSAAADVWRLEGSGWKHDTGTAIACDPAVLRFYSTLIDRAAKAGWLRLLFLKAGSRRIATAYSACFDNRLFLLKTGYDPAFSTGAPFKVLAAFAIQDACARGLDEIDFLGDAEPWKLEWTSSVRGHDWLYVFGRTLRARLLHSIKFQWGPELKRWRC